MLIKDSPNGDSRLPISNLGASYGATHLSQGNNPNSTIFESLGAFASHMHESLGAFTSHVPGVAGTQATEIKPHEQLSQLVGNFLNGIIEHIVRRVVVELEPKLVDPWLLTYETARIRRQEQIEHEKFVAEHPSTADKPWRPWCRDGDECQMWQLRDLISNKGIEVQTIPWNTWNVSKYVQACAFRVVIDSRLFEVRSHPIIWLEDHRKQFVDLVEITDDDHRTVRATIEPILDVIDLMKTGHKLHDAAVHVAEDFKLVPYGAEDAMILMDPKMGHMGSPDVGEGIEE